VRLWIGNAIAIMGVISLLYSVFTFRRWLDRNARTDDYRTRVKLFFFPWFVGRDDFDGPRGPHYLRIILSLAVLSVGIALVKSAAQ
jgi:hypothetical protein